MMATTHLWRDNGLTPQITGLCVCIPMAYHTASLLPEKYRCRDISSEQNKDGLIFNKTTSQFISSKFFSTHLPSQQSLTSTGFIKTDPLDPLRSPLLWPTGHKNLPPMYMVVAGADRWRDSGLIYEEVLREDNGVKTRLDIFGGLIHGFWSIFPGAEFSKEYRRRVDEGLEWLVDQSKEV